MRFVIMVVFLGLLGCSKESSVVISGEKYQYFIDKKYLNDELSSVFGNTLSGDEATVVSLKVPIRLDQNSLSSELSILVFHDRKYSIESDVYEFGQRMISDASRVFDETGTYRYEEQLGASSITYVFSFDPNKEVTLNKPSVSYFAEITIAGNIEVGGYEKIIPKKSCKAYMVLDSMLLQFGGVGFICNDTDFSIVSSKVLALFNSWNNQRGRSN